MVGQAGIGSALVGPPVLFNYALAISENGPHAFATNRDGIRC